MRRGRVWAWLWIALGFLYFLLPLYGTFDFSLRARRGVLLPNLRVALLTGAFLTFATVIGEFARATLLTWPASGPYLVNIGQNRASEPAALALISFALTWACIGLLQFLTRGAPGQ